MSRSSDFGYPPDYRDRHYSQVAKTLDVQAPPSAITYSNGTAMWRLRTEADNSLSFAYSSDSGQTYTMKQAFTDTLVDLTAAEILAGTANNPSTSSTSWSDETAIVFEPNRYRYSIASREATDDDATLMQMLFTLDTSFFPAVEDKLRIGINWLNWNQGRLRVRFLKSNFYAGGFNGELETFAMFIINGNTASQSFSMLWQTHDTTITDQVALQAVTKAGFAASAAGDAVYLQLERLSANEIKATLLDSTLAEFAGQSTLTCNTSGSLDTNAQGIVVQDVTHMVIEEISNSELDLTFEKVR